MEGTGCGSNRILVVQPAQPRRGHLDDTVSAITRTAHSAPLWKVRVVILTASLSPSLRSPAADRDGCLEEALARLVP